MKWNVECWQIFFADVSQTQVQEKEIIVGIVTDIDLLHHVAKIAKTTGSDSSGSNSGRGTPNNELEDNKWSYYLILYFGIMVFLFGRG